MPTKYTLYWHIHHEVLCEGTFDIEERIKYIKENKNKDEIPLRLKLMVPVKNPERLPPEFIKAQEACNKAWEAYTKAWEAYTKVRKACAPEIEKLHKEEHPECPWNGKTIFSKKVD